MKKLSTRNITYYALLISLNIVLTRIGSIRIGGGGVEIIRIGFGGYPIIFAGIIFGPIAGGIVGGIGDFLGYYLNPIGPYMPHFTLTAALTGIIPGLVIMLMRGKDKKKSFWKLLLAIGIGQIMTSLTLTPYFLFRLFSVQPAISLPPRLVEQAIAIPLYSYMTKVIGSRLPSSLNSI